MNNQLFSDPEFQNFCIGALIGGLLGFSAEIGKKLFQIVATLAAVFLIFISIKYGMPGLLAVLQDIFKLLYSYKTWLLGTLIGFLVVNGSFKGV